MASPPRVVVGTPAFEAAHPRGDRQPSNWCTPAPICRPRVAAVGQLVERARRETPGSSSTKVYFLTDLQRATWSPDWPRRRRPNSAGRARRWPSGRAGRDRPGATGRREPGRHRPAGARPVAVVGRTRRLRGHGEELRPPAADRISRSSGWSTAAASREQTLDIPAGGEASVAFSLPLRDARRPHGRSPRRGRRPGDRQPSLPGRARAAVDPRAVHQRPAVGRALPGRDRLPGRGPGARRPAAASRPHRRRRGRGKRLAGTRPGRLRLRVPLRRGPVHRQRSPHVGRLPRATAATWCSSSATRCWPTATTASWAAGQAGRASCPPGSAPSSTSRQSGLDPLGYRHPIVRAFRGQRRRPAC